MAAIGEDGKAMALLTYVCVGEEITLGYTATRSSTERCMRRPRPIDFFSCSDLRLIYGPSNELTEEYLTSSL
ncbi:hypothetical protein U8C37_25245 (plasmid) [Sinorhizobium medicae]|uniref:hypothetical protein n=1 Tax=Sinorhizobium medicae TaxID=110321 RepID=UPI002AF6AFCB|nr:hypothetical protein [Sinorhizobium medicae]WQO88029.1 hypothetical protein U8C37_25245 [Sinorhizobium medicae]